MDELRVRRLKHRYPIEAARLKLMDSDDKVGEILTLMDLDATLGFGVDEYLRTMVGENTTQIYINIVGCLASFQLRVDEIFNDLSSEDKEQIKQSVRSKVCQMNNKA